MTTNHHRYAIKHFYTSSYYYDCILVAKYNSPKPFIIIINNQRKNVDIVVIKTMKNY